MQFIIGRCIHRLAVGSWLLAVVLFSMCTQSAVADPVTWGQTIVVEPSQANIFGSWMRLLHLRNGQWLAATSIYGNGSTTSINLRWSSDDLRTWSATPVTLAVANQSLDNPNLVQLPNGNVLLAMRSTNGDAYHHIQVWTSTDGTAANPFTKNTNDVDFFDNPNSANCPINSQPNSGHPLCGVWEPQLLILPNGNVAIFYADESEQTSGYSQVVSERISTDNGKNWGAKTMAAGVADSASRAGMPYMTHMENGQYLLTYEVCDVNNNCPGSYKTSVDGTTWASGIGTPWSSSSCTSGTSNVLAGSFLNGMLLKVSGTHNTCWSGDYGANWNTMTSAFQGPGNNGEGPWGWQSLYQTRTNEVAQVNGPAIRLGTMAPIPYHDAFAGTNSNEWEAYNGSWAMSGGIMTDSSAGLGDKLMMMGGLSGNGITGYGMHFRDYTTQADIQLLGSGNAGLLVRASSPADGVDSVYAWYIGVSSAGTLFLGDEHNAYSSISGATATVPGGVPSNTWIHLTVTAANCTITAWAKQIARTDAPATFSYTDPTCSAHMGGTIGFRTYGTGLSVRNVTINETGPSPGTNVAYLAPFASGSAPNWTAYGPWAVSGEVYDDGTSLGDKSIVGANGAANVIVQSDLEFGTVNSSPNAGVLVGVTAAQAGMDNLTGFEAGVSPSSLFLGYENNGWTGLTGTSFESTANLVAGSYVHVTVQVKGCQFLVSAQPITQPYGYIQTYLQPGCTSAGSQGVREYNSSTGFRNFSVLPN